MAFSALLLLLVAAALHASWNVLVKRAGEKDIFTWLALLVGSLVCTPLLAINPALPRGVWPYLALSACAQAAYFVGLTYAYTIGDFSLVYPLSRGSAPALLALWAAIFLGERPGWLGMLGLALLLGGLLLVGGLFTQPGMRRITNSLPFSTSAILAALGVALCISLYSVSDGAAVQITAPVPYAIAEFLGTMVLVTPVVLRRYSAGAIVAEWRINWPRIVLVGALMMLTYSMVLLAYSAGHVAYAGALREISVVFAALIGWRWLGEGFGRERVSGAVLIFIGILIIAVAG